MQIGIVGAGQMGMGIAQVCAAAGMQVVLNDISEQAIQKGIGGTAAALEKQLAKGKITPDDRTAILGRISGSASLDAFAPCKFIIEAATENADIKIRILEKIEGVASRDCVIASNTSSMSITKLAASLRYPERFIGLHFFNPVPLMSLVEVISGVQTSEATIAVALDLASALGKVPIKVRNSPGFVVNRILIPMINEAILLLQEKVATAKEIDDGMRLGANHPLGPLALADLIGLDTCLAIMEVMFREFGDPKYRPATLLREMVDSKQLGRKTMQGFYCY